MKIWKNSVPVVLALFLAACVSDKETVAVKQHKTPPGKVIYAANTGSTVRVSPEFKSDAPGKYVVRRGDSLWKIAGMYLKNPGRWKEVWHSNPQIKNPNRIYPGDVLALKTMSGKKRVYVKSRPSGSHGKFTGKRTSSGLKIYNVKPTVINQRLEEPLPTFPVSAIAPFIEKNLVVDSSFGDELAYVVGDSSNTYVSLTQRDIIYAKGEFTQDSYDVYRREDEITDPIDGSNLGYEANYVGELLLVRETNEDGIGTFTQVDKYRPLMPKDVLVPKIEQKAGEPLNVFPSIYDGDEEGLYVVKTIGRSLTGTQFNTLLVKGGREQGLKAGQVFSIVRGTAQTGVGRNGETIKLPDYEVGLAMVYKTMENMSYVLVMNAYDVIYAKDRLVIPPK